MGQRKQLKHIAKTSIEVGDKLKIEFDKNKSVLKARTLINAYRVALRALIILDK
jgi:hypothetical protein